MNDKEKQIRELIRQETAKEIISDIIEMQRECYMDKAIIETLSSRYNVKLQEDEDV